MIYSIKFVYNDGKDLVINIIEANAAEFFNRLSTKTVYFDEQNNVGFWTDLDKVRYIEMRKVPVEGEKNADVQPEAGPAEISPDVGDVAPAA